jgi:hypothetical protein
MPNRVKIDNQSEAMCCEMYIDEMYIDESLRKYLTVCYIALVLIDALHS